MPPEAQEWQPQMPADRVQQLMKLYDDTPSRFTQEQIDNLKQHASHYGMPFYSGDFSLLEAVKQFGGGVVEGFTTIGTVDHPDNEYEAIIRNVGHLVGFMPGILSKPLGIFSKSLGAKAAALKSIPIRVADAAQEKVAPIFSKFVKSAAVKRTGATKDVSNFLLGHQAKHVIEGAFHLGVASGFASWQGGIDEMIRGFIGGAKAGAVFKLIGNYVKVGNPAGQKLARSLAGSLFMGLPATAMGATTPEQVYEYLMGAYFGSQEVSWARHRARKELVKMQDEAKDNKNLFVSMDPEISKRWEGLPEEVKPILKEEAKKIFEGTEENRAAAWELSKLTKNLWQVEPTVEEMAGFEATGEYVEGEKRMRPTKEVTHQIMGSGDVGASEIFANEGFNRGFRTNIHTIKGRPAAGRGLRIHMMESELRKADPHVQKANQTLDRNIARLVQATTFKKKAEFNDIRRMFYTIDRGNSVYALGTFEQAKAASKWKKEIRLNTRVKGKTGWGVQMGIDQKKPVHLFDLKTRKWHTWSRKNQIFEPLPGLPPRPTKLFSGIGDVGTRGKKGKFFFPAVGKKAVKDLFDAYYKKTETALGREEVQKRKAAGTLVTSVSDKDKTSLPLSNYAEIKFNFRGKYFRNAAAAYQAWKTGLYQKGYTDLTGAQAELKGRKIKPKRAESEGLMEEIITAKYKQSEKYRNALQKVQNLEYKTEDKFWKKKFPEIVKRVSEREEIEEIKYEEVDPLRDVLTKEEKLQLDEATTKLDELEKLREEAEIEGEKNTDIHGEPIDADIEFAINQRISDIESDAETFLKIKRRLENRGEELAEGVVEKDTTELENRETSSSSEDLDLFDETDVQVGKRALWFSKNHLPKELWQAPELTQTDVAHRQAQIANIVQKIIRKYVQRGSKVNNVSDIITEIENTFSTAGQPLSLSQNYDARAELRQWVTTYNLGEFVKHFRATPEKIMEMPVEAGVVRSMSIGGNRKEMKEPRKLIQEIYKDEGGKGAAYGISDHITIVEDGMPKDIEYSRYRERDDVGAFKWNTTLSQYMKYMNAPSRKGKGGGGGGWYIYGGKGDNDRLLWMRYHPKMGLGKANFYKQWRQLKQWMKKADSSFPKYLKEAREEFIDFYGTEDPKSKRMSKDEAREVFHRSFTSNVLYDLSLNKFTFNEANIKKLLGKGFIKNASAFNKRQQIWFTNSWNGDSSMIKEQIKDLYLNPDNTFAYKYIISSDLSDEVAAKYDKTNKKKYVDKYAWDILRKNTELGENVDGAIIVRDDVIDAINADFGMPKSGQNKSFIISPDAEHGALLGKFMFHAAGETASKAMKKDGLHMIMHESAVKQEGTRRKLQYEITADNVIYNRVFKRDVPQLTADDTVITNQLNHGEYLLKPEEVKGNFSVKQSSHMMEDQAIPKQLFTSLMPLSWKEIDGAVINDMYASIIGERFRGEDISNERVENYLTAREKGISNKELRSEANQIIKNLDKLGIAETIKLLKADFSEEVSAAAYQSILKNSIELLKAEYADRKLTKEQFNSALQKWQEDTDATNKHIRVALRWAQAERGRGKDANALATLLHKYVRDFRLTAVKNYIVQSATRPKMANSLSSVMRPYDKAMRTDLDKVNKWLPKLDEVGNKKIANILGKDVFADEIFFLDNDFKTRKINTGILGLKTKTLGELWDMYSAGQFKGKTKDKIEDIFNAVTVRAPMDSMSGAQVLHFRGFTGRKGHGILLHGRAMRAEGGADLDGDKSFVFFGGEGGMKESWKDMYRSNKEEFYFDEVKKKGKKLVKTGRKLVGDNKEATVPEGEIHAGQPYRQFLTKQFGGGDPAIEKAIKNKLNSKAYQYSIGERIRISEAAVDGRNQLGPATSSTQIMASTYNAIMATDNKTDTFETNVSIKGNKKDKFGKPIYYHPRVQVTIEAKTSTNARQNQSNIKRAMIGLASDPLDELGLKGRDAWFTELWNAYFKLGKVYEVTANGKLKKPSSNVQKAINSQIKGNKLKGGLYKHFSNINQAYWGKNWGEGRQYNMHEIQELGQSAYSIAQNPEMVNSFLGKIGVELGGLDWSDPVFGRINEAELNNLYTNFNAALKDKESVKRILGRTSLSVSNNPYAKKVFDNKLFTKEGIENSVIDYPTFTKIIKGTPYEQLTHRTKRAENDPQIRREMLREMTTVAEDFLINDITDMISVKLVTDALRDVTKDGFLLQPGISINKQVDHIFKNVEALKDVSWLKRKERQSIDENIKVLQDEGLEGNEFIAEVKKIMVEQFKDDPASKAIVSKLNKDIAGRSTATLDQIEIDNSIAAFKKQLTPAGERLFDHLMLGSLRQGDLSKIEKFINENPINSKVALDIVHNLRMDAAKTSMSKLGFLSASTNEKHLSEHVGAFNEVMGKTWKKPSKETVDSVIKAENDITDKEAMAVNLPVKEESVANNEISSTFAPTGFEGLKQGALDPEYKSIISELAVLLQGQGGYVKTKLNGITRGLLNKDINAMHKADFITLRNYFQEIKNGSIWQRIFDTKGPTKLSRRHHWLFPKAVNEELMRDQLLMLKKRGLYIDASGKAKMGTTYVPTHYLGRIQNVIGGLLDESVNIEDSFIKDANERMLFLGELADGESLRTIAVAHRNDRYGRHLHGQGDRDNAKKYFKLRTDTEKAHDWKTLKTKEYIINLENKRQTVTGEELVKIINERYTEYFEEFHSFIKGDPDWLEKNGMIVTYLNRDKKEQPIIDIDKFTDYVETKWRDGKVDKQFWKDIGIEGMRKVARSIMYNMIKDPKIKAQYLSDTTGKIGKISFDQYWPQMMFNRKTAMKAKKAELKRIMETPGTEMTTEQRNKALTRLAYKYRAVDGEWPLEELEEWNVVEQVVRDISKNKERAAQTIKDFNPNEKTGNMLTRSSHMEGFTLDNAAVDAYTRSMVKSYFKQLIQIITNRSVDQMGKDMYRKWGKDQTKAWQQYAKLFIQDAIGNAANIPKHVYDNPDMKIKGTPYGWWADNRVQDKVNKMLRAVGLTDKSLPENMQGIDISTIRHLSNLEAQFEMASLLAHPKSIVNNIFGGTAHTIQSAGWKNFRNARNWKFLSKINPEWKSKEDVDAFVVSQGVFPDFMIHDFGLHQEYQTVKNKEFISKIARKMGRDPELSEESVRDIAIKSNIPKKVMEFAAKFMSVPERALRRDAFMAHYLHAWEKFGGAFPHHGHPFIVELAKKGVQATQFLYSATYRPAFARTALGKVMSRFQLWSWNAVRFRNEVAKEARVYGLQPGTDSYKKFVRTAQIDMTVLALANLFFYSIFEQTLPAPWNWLQDTAEWIFGDEKERNRAFFGAYPTEIAPLQMISPPILRLLPQSIRALVDDDWSKVAEYGVWTMFPFGRMAKDIIGPNNLIENPMRLMEKTTGFPLGQLQREAKAIKEEKYEKQLFPGSYKR